MCGGGYPSPNSRWAASPPPSVELPLDCAEGCAAACPPELDAALDVNSFVALNAPVELASPAELDSSFAVSPPAEAALALGAPGADAEEEDDEEVPAKARSGPNSRLALAAGVSACADVVADAAPGRPDEAPSVGVTPDTSPVS